MAERTPKDPALDVPVETTRRFRLRPRRGARGDSDTFGRVAEGTARLMGTPGFLAWMTAIVVVWLTWNSLAPVEWQWDRRDLNFTLLTLILSLQASYAAPLLLLAQNRQDDRDRVTLEQDRQNAERNHATTEFITREIASLRLSVQDVATRDFVRSELRDLAEEVTDREELRRQLLAEVRAELEADYEQRLQETLRRAGVAPATEGT